MGGDKEKEIDNLKEVVRTQQKLLHQLYTELEAEREASATAASEALSMILRLQREKASERLEASQFKRLIEEKMHHAEEVMDIFEDLMHQKEMHIASLEFQVQAYRYKMLSMGLTESDIGESEFDEAMLLPPPTSTSSSASHPSSPTHINTTTVLHRDDLPHLTLRRTTSWGSSSSSSSSSSSQKPKPPSFAFNKSSSDQESSDLTSYMEQIKELDQRVKGLSSSATQNNTRRRKRSSRPSPSPQHHGDSNSLSLHHPAVETESVPSTSHSQSTRIHDIFEVPQYHNQSTPQPPPPQGKKLLLLDDENRLGKPGIINEPEPAGCINTHLGNQFINNLPRDTICVNCHLALVHPQGILSPFQSQFQHLNKRLDKLEGERRDVDHHRVSTDNDEEEEEEKEDEKLKLLKDIHEQLNTIKSQITSTNPNNHPPPVADEPCLVSLMEAMFFYSL